MASFRHWRLFHSVEDGMGIIQDHRRRPNSCCLAPMAFLAQNPEMLFACLAASFWHDVNFMVKRNAREMYKIIHSVIVVVSPGNQCCLTGINWEVVLNHRGWAIGGKPTASIAVQSLGEVDDLVVASNKRFRHEGRFGG